MRGAGSATRCRVCALVLVLACASLAPTAGQANSTCALTVNAENCAEAELACSAAVSLLNESTIEASCGQEEEGPSCVDGLQVAKLLLWDLTGFNLPCSITDAAANFVLLVVYGILVYFASSMLTTAMDALESAQFGTAACLGGCFMPLLGAAPDAMLIVATTTSQASVAFGVKILANSNVVLLTIPWVIALFMGRRPLTLLQPSERARQRKERLNSEDNGGDEDETAACSTKDISPPIVAQYHGEPAQACCALDLSKPATSCRERCTCGCGTKSFWSMTGITVYPEVKDQAEMMLATLLPFVVVQCIVFANQESHVFNESITVTEQENTGYLATAILCFCFIIYLVSMTFVSGGARQKEYQGYIHERHMYVQQSQWIKFSAFYGQSGKPEDVLAALQGIAEVAIKAPETSKLLENLERQPTTVKKQASSGEPKRANGFTARSPDGGEKVPDHHHHHDNDHDSDNDGGDGNETGLAMVSVRVGSDHEGQEDAQVQSRPTGDAVLDKPGKRNSITKYTSNPEVVRRHLSAAKHPHLTRVRASSSGRYSVEMTINARLNDAGADRVSESKHHDAESKDNSNVAQRLGYVVPPRKLVRKRAAGQTRASVRNALKLSWVERSDEHEAVRQREEELASLPEEQNVIFNEFWAWCTPKAHLRTIFSVWKYNAKHHKFEQLHKTATGESADGGDEEVEEGVVPHQVGCITCSNSSMKRWFVAQAFLKIVAALVLIAILAEPFVDSVSRFGALTGIPEGIMAAVIPIVSNLNELIASVLFTATAVKGKNSMMYTALYSAVSMNNSLALGMFLIAIYVNNNGITGITYQLTTACPPPVFYWEFSPDLIAMLLTMVVVGGIGAFSVTYRLFAVWPVGLLFPASIGLAIAVQVGAASLPLQASLFGILAAVLVCMVGYVSVVEIMFQCRRCHVARQRREEANPVIQQLQDNADAVEAEAAAEEGRSATPSSSTRNKEQNLDANLLAAFEFIDTDRDGEVKPRELYTLLNALGFQVKHKDIEKMIRLIDRDASGTVNFQEFSQLVKAHENSPARQEAIMREAFLQFDSDRDGFIQLDDLRRMAVRLGEVVEDDMLQSMLHDADVDADDGINFEEFKQILVHTGLFEAGSATPSDASSDPGQPHLDVVPDADEDEDEDEDDDEEEEEHDDDDDGDEDEPEADEAREGGGDAITPVTSVGSSVSDASRQATGNSNDSGAAKVPVDVAPRAESETAAGPDTKISTSNTNGEEADSKADSTVPQATETKLATEEAAALSSAEVSHQSSSGAASDSKN